MEFKKNNITEDIPRDVAAIPYVAYEMVERRQEKREMLHFIIHGIMAVVILAIVGMFVWLWNQYDTISTTEATGVYALVDSTGNVISADIPVERIPEIIKSLEDIYGEGKSDKKAG